MRDRLTIRSGSALVLLAALATIGCQPAETGKMQETTVDTAAVMSSLDSLRQAFLDAYNAGDTAAVAALFTEDAVRLPPDAPPVRGADAVAANFAQAWAQGAHLDDLSPLETNLASADWAFEHGTYQVTVTPEGADEGRTMEGSYLVVLHRTADGWKLARDAATYDSVPPAPSGQ